MISSFFPAILLPIMTLFLPGVAMAFIFIYIEQESVE
jgi:hypothetical protein